MNAYNTELQRIQEIYDVVNQTQNQILEIGMTKERFLNPTNATECYIANCAI